MKVNVIFVIPDLPSMHKLTLPVLHLWTRIQNKQIYRHPASGWLDFLVRL